VLDLLKFERIFFSSDKNKIRQYRAFL